MQYRIHESEDAFHPRGRVLVLQDGDVLTQVTGLTGAAAELVAECAGF